MALLALAPAALAYKGLLLSASAVARRGRLLGLLLLGTMLGVSAIAFVNARSPQLGPAFAGGGMPLVAGRRRGRPAAPCARH